jgi:hypothetical protein
LSLDIASTEYMCAESGWAFGTQLRTEQRREEFGITLRLLESGTRTDVDGGGREMRSSRFIFGKLPLPASDFT